MPFRRCCCCAELDPAAFDTALTSNAGWIRFGHRSQPFCVLLWPSSMLPVTPGGLEDLHNARANELAAVTQSTTSPAGLAAISANVLFSEA